MSKTTMFDQNTKKAGEIISLGDKLHPTLQHVMVSRAGANDDDHIKIENNDQ